MLQFSTDVRFCVFNIAIAADVGLMFMNSSELTQVDNFT